jgi:hypothetical protein
MSIPTSYTYLKRIDYPNEVVPLIAQAGLPIDRIDTVGSGDAMSINVWFTDILSEDQQNSLTTIITNYSNPSITPQTLASIVSALNTDANVVALLRTKITMELPGMPVQTIRAICSILGIPMS